MRLVFGLLEALASIGAIAAALGLVLGLLQDFHPAMDSFSHFRVHFAAVLTICAGLLVVLAAGRKRWVALAIGALCVVWIGMMMRQGPPQEAPGGDIRIVQFNLNFGNRSMPRVAEALVNLDADVVTVQEVPPAHEATLRAISIYPHQVHCPFRNRIGAVSILSKYPVIGSPVCAEGRGLVAARLDVPGGAVTVASAHTYWPWPLSQHAQIDEWEPVLASLEGPIIVAGDFNAAPWSHAVQRVADASGTSVVPGLRMTIEVKAFPVLPAVPIPIDHVLLSKDFCALAAAVGPVLGSDHFPVIVDIGRKPSKRCGAAS